MGLFDLRDKVASVDLEILFGPEPPPELRSEVEALPPALASVLLKSLAGDSKALETTRTALSLFEAVDEVECGRAFGLLKDLKPGPLRGWWLRAVFDLPGWSRPLGRALRGFLSDETAALEFIQKAPALLRRLGLGPGGALLKLVAPLAASDPSLTLEIFLQAPENLADLKADQQQLALGRAARLGPEPLAAAALLASAGKIMGQAGPRGFDRWVKIGLNQPIDKRAAFFSLNAPDSLAALDEAAGGLSLAAAARRLSFYGQSLTGTEVKIRSLERPPEEVIVSPLAAAARRSETIFLPARQGGRDPLDIFRARTALAAWSRPPGWDFLLATPDPWLAADLWALAEEYRVARRLRRLYPGLRRPLARLNRGRHADLSSNPPLMHPALKMAARRLWGGRLPRAAGEAAALALELTAVLKKGPRTEEAVRRALTLLNTPRAQALAPERAEAGPKLKFSAGEERRLFEATPGLQKDRRGATLSRGRAERGQFLANLNQLRERLRRRADEAAADAPRQNRTFYYPEWDFGLKAHRLDWVRVIESAPRPGDEAEAIFVSAVRPSLVKRIKAQFLRLRPQGLERLGRQWDGQEVDLEPAVAWAVDRLRGETPEEKVYLSRRLIKREVVGGLLLDLSGSTAERLRSDGPTILEVARQGLFLLAEALACLGDDFGLFGFTGSGRTRVDFIVLKDFDEAWDKRVKTRLYHLKPGLQNRDGAAIRHAASRLSLHPARRRILIFVSDGRPDDYDYTGRHAFEDTRAALKEARQKGLAIFCLTIDRRARDYIAEMMGATPYVILDDASRLPEFLPRLYQRLAG